MTASASTGRQKEQQQQQQQEQQAQQEQEKQEQQQEQQEKQEQQEQQEQREQQHLPHHAYSSSTEATARNDERIDQTTAMTNSKNYYASSYPIAGNQSNHSNNYSANIYSSAEQQNIFPRNALLTTCPWISRDEASDALLNADGDVERAKTALYRAAASSIALAYSQNAAFGSDDSRTMPWDQHGWIPPENSGMQKTPNKVGAWRISSVMSWFTF